MEKVTIDQLLNNIAALAGDARGSLFGQDKCMVDRDQLLYLVDALRNEIPKQISEAGSIIESCNALRTNAKKDAAETRRAADKVLKDAEERAAKLIEESQIVVFAKQREQEILENAQQQKDMLIAGAVAYADRIMEEAEQNVIATYDTLTQGIDLLKQRAEEDRKAALAQVKEARVALQNVSKSEEKKK